MNAVLIYLVLPAATFILGGLLGAMLTRGIDRGVVVTVEDKPFVDEWRDEIAETPYCAGMETDIVQAIRLSDGRPAPGPRLRSCAVSAAEFEIGQQVIFRENAEHPRILGVVTRLWTNDKYVTVRTDGRCFVRCVGEVEPCQRECDPDCNLDPADDERHDQYGGCLTDDEVAELRLMARDYETWAEL